MCTCRRAKCRCQNSAIFFQDVKTAKPDLVVFVGDYTDNPSVIDNMSNHRENIINAIKLVNLIPRAIVLGNYESWSDADGWLDEFDRLGVDVTENEKRTLGTDKGSICIRGFGDNFTARYRYADYPEECEGVPKLSITHDPSGCSGQLIPDTSLRIFS
jgi:3',5'-cyclic AMP phosphodiesterase CpdA